MIAARSQPVQSVLFVAALMALSLGLTAALILAVGRDPLEVFSLVWSGAFSSGQSLAGTLNFALPVIMTCAGLVVTFRAGLWNIGVEGQIMLGAVGASAVALFPPDLPPLVVVALAIAGGALGGALWALLAAALKVWLGVHEIFGGTALNALANVLSIYLISGPWLPAEGGSAQGTAPFVATARLGALSPDFAISGVMLALTVGAYALVVVLLNHTRWGLELKATGKNARSALLLGVPVRRSVISAMLVCGALAGIVGAYRVLFVYSNLRPLASGGIGFLALMVVLLAGMRLAVVPLVGFFFAAILAGSTRLKIALQLDPSLAGVMQGMLVLISLFLNGVRERWFSGDKS
jgi:simple sugar transport system permease protein